MSYIIEDEGLGRRTFLKSSGWAAGAAFAAGVGLAEDAFAAALEAPRFVQRVDSARFYMTRYALFDEPDPDLPRALYLDAVTGAPTSAMTLKAPIGRRLFQDGDEVGSPSFKVMPYVLRPPGFREIPAPASVLGLLQRATGLAPGLTAPRTHVRLVAFGTFIDHGPGSARLEDRSFSITKDLEFVVRLRLTFLFSSPDPNVPSVGVVLPYVTMDDLHGLLRLPPPAVGGSDLVFYSWRAPMTLSTRNEFVRSIADEPPPVASPFPIGKTEIAMQGVDVDEEGGYTVVGMVDSPEFMAPQVLLDRLFGGQIPNVEFAVMETGTLQAS
jgi:hypothetical protein